jgi:hypothetical protein
MSVQASAAVWENSQASGSTLIVLLALANRSDERGVSFEGVETIAKKCRMGVRNCQYQIRKLQAMGELTVDYGASPYKTNLYTIRVRGVQSSAPGGVQNRDAKLHPIRSDTYNPSGAETCTPCPNCGKRLDDDRYCPECEVVFPASMVAG